MYVLQEDTGTNPYQWDFDFCSLTLGNFNYRKMSLVRDYTTLLEQDVPNPAFDAVFSLQPRTADAQALEPLGTLLLSMSTAQINTLNFSDANAIDTLAVLGALQSWTDEQVTALAERVRRTYTRPAKKWSASDLAAMGRVLCGMTTEIDEHVSKASFAAAIVAIGEMRQCPPPALAAMARRAVQIYNETKHWTPATVQTLGIIVAGQARARANHYQRVSPF